MIRLLPFLLLGVPELALNINNPVGSLFGLLRNGLLVLWCSWWLLSSRRESPPFALRFVLVLAIAGGLGITALLAVMEWRFLVLFPLLWLVGWMSLPPSWGRWRWRWALALSGLMMPIFMLLALDTMAHTLDREDMFKGSKNESIRWNFLPQKGMTYRFFFNKDGSSLFAMFFAPKQKPPFWSFRLGSEDGQELEAFTPHVGTGWRSDPFYDANLIIGLQETSLLLFDARSLEIVGRRFLTSNVMERQYVYGKDIPPEVEAKGFSDTLQSVNVFKDRKQALVLRNNGQVTLHPLGDLNHTAATLNVKPPELPDFSAKGNAFSDSLLLEDRYLLINTFQGFLVCQDFQEGTATWRWLPGSIGHLEASSTPGECYLNLFPWGVMMRVSYPALRVLEVFRVRPGVRYFGLLPEHNLLVTGDFLRGMVDLVDLRTHERMASVNVAPRIQWLASWKQEPGSIIIGHKFGLTRLEAAALRQSPVFEPEQYPGIFSYATVGRRFLAPDIITERKFHIHTGLNILYQVVATLFLGMVFLTLYLKKRKETEIH